MLAAAYRQLRNGSCLLVCLDSFVRVVGHRELRICSSESDRVGNRASAGTELQIRIDACISSTCLMLVSHRQLDIHNCAAVTFTGP